MAREDNQHLRRKRNNEMNDIVTITRTPMQRATFSAGKQSAAVRDASWGIVRQDVVAYGSPSDAGAGGRLAVRENAEALRRLRDA